jgi:RNA polymerase sigma-70 factor (ECF subfamily)
VIRSGNTGGQRTVGSSGTAPRGLDGTEEGPSDAELVQRSCVDPEAFGLLYDRYCDRIHRFVYRRLKDRESAEDVTAEVFFKALKAIDGYRPATAPFSAWLYRIAGNAVIDHVRARKATVSLDAAMDATDRATPVDEQAMNRLEVAKVWEAIDCLTQAQRTAVLLRLERDLPIAEIAGRMNRSEGAVKLLLHRGLAAVRENLKRGQRGQVEPA